MPRRRPSARARSLVAIALVAATGCSTSSSLEPIGAGRPVLFVGNSQTYVNELPWIVQAMADSAGGEALAVAMVAYPDVSLEDHWRRGDARKAIASRQWSVVVLQQGPSSTEANRASLRAMALRFAPEIRRSGARPALFGVWPSADRQADFDRATESYALAAADVDGLHLPAGEGWRAVWREDPTAPLYADGLHGSVAGSYVAALVIYAGITGKPPLGLPARLRLRSGAVIAVPAELAPTLQRAAAAAMERHGRR